MAAFALPPNLGPHRFKLSALLRSGGLFAPAAFASLIGAIQFSTAQSACIVDAYARHPACVRVAYASHPHIFRLIIIT